MGEWFLQLYQGNLFNPSGKQLQCYLAKELTPTICTLIKIFGLIQFVLVPPQGDPFSLERTALCVPKTLHLCLYLSYACQFIIIHGVPKSTGAILQTHHQHNRLQVVRAEWTQHLFNNNREIFGNFKYTPVTKSKNQYSRFLYSRAS